jgi:hypothetical protein
MDGRGRSHDPGDAPEDPRVGVTSRAARALDGHVRDDLPGGEEGRAAMMTTAQTGSLAHARQFVGGDRSTDLGATTGAVPGNS